jgi:hypothetical protein
MTLVVSRAGVVVPGVGTDRLVAVGPGAGPVPQAATSSEAKATAPGAPVRARRLGLR